MNILWHFSGVGFVLLGCWLYLKPHVVFGLRDSAFADRFIRGWSLGAIFVGWSGLLSIASEFQDSEVTGEILFLVATVVAAFMTWFTRRLLRSSLTAKSRQGN